MKFRQDFQDMAGLVRAWVPCSDYERAVALCKEAKEEALMETLSEEKRAEILGHRPLDDMDEGKYL
jgi:hypothetical protein